MLDVAIRPLAVLVLYGLHRVCGVAFERTHHESAEMQWMKLFLDGRVSFLTIVSLVLRERFGTQLKTDIARSSMRT